MMRRRARSADESVPDEALLFGMAIGDERASLLFVRRYQRRLFGLTMAIVRDPELAEDVAQEAFLRIFRHASVFDPRRGSVATWALTITRNLAIDALRARRSFPADPDDHVFLDLMSEDRQPDDLALASDASVRVQTALIGLPLEQRRAIVLAAIYGRTAVEVAELEKIPVGTAKGRIRLGMAKLRDVVAIAEDS